MLAANAIVAVYSLFEMVASVWEISRDTTLFPESLQVWFDFGHDQVQTLNLLIYLFFSKKKYSGFINVFCFFVCVCVWGRCDLLGVRVPVGVGKFRGNGDGEDAEEHQHVYGHKCILRPIRYFDRIGIRGVSVPRVFFSALGFSGRLFHNQRLSFSSLNRESEGEIRGIFECVGNVGFFLLCTVLCD